MVFGSDHYQLDAFSLDSSQDHHHNETAFGSCWRNSGTKAAAAPARSGPIIPSNCKTHLTCKPVHPVRNDIWSGWQAYASEWFTTTALWVTGGAVTLGACVYGFSKIGEARRKRRDARLRADGRRPPSDGESSGESDDEQLRGQRG
jgi:hypothetical protein